MINLDMNCFIKPNHECTSTWYKKMNREYLRSYY